MKSIKPTYIFLQFFFAAAFLQGYSQFYYFKPNNDSCYCEDIIILGEKRFDSLVEIISFQRPLTHVRLPYGKRIAVEELHKCCVEKQNIARVSTKKHKDFKNSFFENNVYVVLSWPQFQFGKDVLLPCVTDSLHTVLKETLYYGDIACYSPEERYIRGKYFLKDIIHHRFIVVLVSVNMYNKFMIGYNVSPLALIRPNDKHNEGRYIKLLFPILEKP